MDVQILQALWAATVASSVAIVLALVLRTSARRALGAELAYALWTLVPVAIVAALVPAPRLGGAAFGAIPQLPAIAVGAHSATDGAASFPFGALVLVLWGAGACAFGATFVRQQLRFTRELARGAVALEAHDGVPVARANAGPLVVGALRPRIVVPVDFESRYDANERALILAHERTHVRRGDGIANALAATLRAAFWFNPLVHRAVARFRFDQELACDAAVMRARPGARRAYAQAMLKTQLTDLGLPVGCYWQSSQPLKERILMLKQDAVSKLRTRLGACALGLSIVSFGAVTLAAQPSSPLRATEQSAEAMPTYRSMKPIDYPKAALDAKAQGDVKVRVLVAVDGSVKDARVDDSSASLAKPLQDASVSGVKTWRFNPARRDGKLVEQWVAITISYRLDGSDAPAADPAPGELDSIRIAPQA